MVKRTIKNGKDNRNHHICNLNSSPYSNIIIIALSHEQDRYSGALANLLVLIKNHDLAFITWFTLPRDDLCFVCRAKAENKLPA